jgi:hypothetical protein
VNHQDAVFARYYFDQFDDWRAGRIEEVSPAWRIAFDSADRKRVSGMGNVFLGMNAHVNRDLPFVLAEIGLVKPDGTSRKVDHDRVNDFLAATNQYLLAEAAKYLDPTLDDGDVPGTRSTTRWPSRPSSPGASRRGATPSASCPPPPRSRALVAQEIEQAAALEALVIRTIVRLHPAAQPARPRREGSRPLLRRELRRPLTLGAAESRAAGRPP